MKFKKKVMIAAAIALISGGALAARTLYVTSPAAKLLREPNMASAGTPLQKGQPLTEIGERGAFYEVRGPGGSAFVSKMFVSPFPPQQNPVGANDLRRDPNVSLSRQAGAVSETAAARGLSGGGAQVEDVPPQYNEAQVKWLEAQRVSRAEINAFLRAGRLNPAE
jgi:hypothetical protein